MSSYNARQTASFSDSSVKGGIEVKADKLGAPRVDACKVRDCSISALYSFSSWVTFHELCTIFSSDELTLLVLLLYTFA